MYTPNKYNYVPLLRETINGSRKYATPDGEKLPSVTTILDFTKSEESKQALQNWRKRVGVQKAQISKLESSANSATIDTILKVFKALKAEINFNVKLEENFVKLV